MENVERVNFIMATRTIISPSKYIQGKGELLQLKKYISFFGKKAFIIADEIVMSLVKSKIEKGFKDEKEYKLFFEKFNGESTRNEINRLSELYKRYECDVVIGIGGGKTLDTAKAVAIPRNYPVIIIPTIASTDAPCSALSVIYTEEGEFEFDMLHSKNPDIVLVDTEVVAQAPVRLLVAGMGDALATYIEARACRIADADNFAGGKATNAAINLAELCYEILLEDGLKAKLAVEKKVCTKAVENVIEANIFLSGIGFESNGCAAAHSIYNGFTVLKDSHQYYHGEWVAFGVLVQLVLDNAPSEELDEVINFCLNVGLPFTLKDFGLEDITKEDLMKVAEKTCSEGQVIHKLSYDVTPDDVYAAILNADSIGQMYK
jgi:glycerol dehydrogenase